MSHDIFAAFDDTSIDEEEIRKKNRSSILLRGRKEEFFKFEFLVKELDGINNLYKWGSSTGSEVYDAPLAKPEIPGGSGRFRMHNQFEGLETLRVIAVNEGTQECWGSFETLRTELMEAHSIFPTEAAKKHGPHCQASNHAKAKCVEDGHHVGWWHSTQAAMFVMDGYRDFESMKLPCQQAGLNNHNKEECQICKWNIDIDDLKEAREARHDERPDITERRHAGHFKNLVSSSVNMTRLVSDIPKPGYRLVPGHFFNIGALGPITANMSLVEFTPDKWVRFAREMEISPYKELEADPKTNDQNRYDIQWHEIDNVVDPPEDTETLRGNPRGLVGTSLRRLEGGSVEQLGKPRVSQWWVWKNDVAFWKGKWYLMASHIRLKNPMLADTGSLPEPKETPRMSVPMPFFNVEEIVGTRGTYTYNREARGWTNGDDRLDKSLFDYIRSSCRRVIKDFSDWGHTLSRFDDIYMPDDGLITNVAKDLYLIGIHATDKKNKEIMSLPEGIIWKNREKMRNGKIMEGRVQSMGSLPFRLYDCIVCRRETPHIKDCWKAGSYQGRIKFHPSLYGTSNHWKCIECGMTAMRKALKVTVTTKLKDGGATWKVTGYIFGDGYFKEWQTWHDQNGTRLSQILSLASQTRALVRANPVYGMHLNANKEVGEAIDF